MSYLPALPAPALPAPAMEVPVAMEQFFERPIGSSESPPQTWTLVACGDTYWWRHGPTGYGHEAQAKMVQIKAHEQFELQAQTTDLRAQNAVLQKQVEELVNVFAGNTVPARGHAIPSVPAAVPSPPAAGANVPQTPCTHHGPCKLSVHDMDKMQEPGGEVVTEVWRWHSHLGSTLFATNNTKGNKLSARLTQAVANQFIITSCRTKANRFFHVQCKTCRAACYGDYNTWCTPKEIEKAQDDLLLFLNVQLPEEPAKV